VKIDFSKPLTKEEETFVIEQYHKIIDGDNKGIDSPDIKEYEHKIGMSQLIKIHLDIRRNLRGDHGKYWMALSPSWISKDDKTHDTKFRIIYWVNYGDDETFGWFTVEQIRQWLETPTLKLYKLGGTRERISGK
jgi:hypothetical protein